MALELKQNLQLKLTQQLVMTPQLQLSIKLLQLNRLELNELVAKEMIENPVLEERTDGDEADSAEAGPVDESGELDGAIAGSGPVEEGAGEAPGADLEMGGADGEAVQGEPGVVVEGQGETEPSPRDELDLPWEAMAETYAYQLPGSGARRDDDEFPTYEQTLTRHETLHEHLLWQLKLAPDLNELKQEIGVRIIGDLDDDGYLKPAEAEAGDQVDPVAAIASDLEVPAEWVEAVRQRIMRFDPVGCAALDVRECLLVQLEVLGYDDDDLVVRMVRDHLKEIENRNFKAVARKLKVPLEEIGEALKVVQGLEPKPGRPFLSNGTPAEAQYITPDIYVRKVGDDYVITLNEDGLPRLRVSRFYLNKLRQGGRDKTSSYIRERLRSATWLIRSIQQRQRTIYRVMEAIVRHQREFFDKGVEYLKPMVLQDIARDLGLHESTVSRVTSNKYVHTPQGIFELKYFFNSSIRRTDGDDTSSAAVKNMIRQIIAEEDPRKPYSDAQIVELLKKKKISIARRTVAKYREAMGILPSSKRKKIFA